MRFNWRSKRMRNWTLLHVLPEPSALDYTLGGFPETEQDRAKEEASSLLDEAVAHAKRIFLEIDSGLRTGLDLRHEILNTAKEISADLLVLTTHHLLVGKTCCLAPMPKRFWNTLNVPS